MTSILVRISATAVRTWTSIYTWRMPRSVREARRAEIESDLWECQADDGASPALPIQIIGRLVLGIFDDVRWRVGHMNRNSHVARAVALSIATTAVLTCVWVVLGITTGAAPQAPATPEVRWERVEYPPPPPPPPPPCNPPGIGRKLFSPCTPYK